MKQKREDLNGSVEAQDIPLLLPMVYGNFLKFKT